MDQQTHVEVEYYDSQGKYSLWVPKAGVRNVLRDHFVENAPFAKHIRSRLFSYGPKIEVKNESTLTTEFKLRGFHEVPGIFNHLHSPVTDYETKIKLIKCRCPDCGRGRDCGYELLDLSLGVCNIQVDREGSVKSNRKRPPKRQNTTNEFRYCGDLVAFPGTMLDSTTLGMSLIRIRMLRYRDANGIGHLETFRFGPKQRIHQTPIAYVIAEVALLNRSWREVIKRCEQDLFALNVSISSDSLSTDRQFLRKLVKYAQTWDQFHRIQQQQLTALKYFEERTTENRSWFYLDQLPDESPSAIKNLPRLEVGSGMAGTLMVGEVPLASSVGSSISGIEAIVRPRTVVKGGEEISGVLKELEDIGRTIEIQLAKETRKLIERTHNIISIDEAYRSRDQNESVKRLSWITFVFLPLLFVSSLFGMNIDILKNDPAWTYYLAFSLPMFCLIMVSVFTWKKWEVFTIFLRDFKKSKDHLFLPRRPKAVVIDPEQALIDRRYELLVVASEDGNLEEVRDLVKQGVDVNTLIRSGPTALQSASKSGHIDVVERLIKYGADVNAQLPMTNGGLTALQGAAGEGHLEVVKLLIAQGADINAAPAPDGGRTALQAAAGGGHLEIVQLLLERGADINAEPAPQGGRTALQAAVECGSVAIFDLLYNFKGGLDQNQSQMFSRRLTSRSSWQIRGAGKKPTLGHGVDINAEPAGVDGRTALQAAAEGGYLEIVERLLLCGADANKPAAHEGGSTALEAASGRGYRDIVELLINYGARVAGAEGCVALKAAASAGRLQIVELLISHQAEVNHPYPGGVLQAAARGGHYMVVDLLLSKGAEVNAAVPGRVGTALAAAAMHGHEDVVGLLIRSGAHIDQMGIEGHTPLQAAIENGQDQMAELLVRRGADVNSGHGITPLQIAAGQGQSHIVDMLMRNGAEVNAPPAVNGLTALQAAAAGGHRQVVGVLLDHGALVDGAALQLVQMNAEKALPRLKREYDEIMAMLERTGWGRYG